LHILKQFFGFIPYCFQTANFNGSVTCRVCRIHGAFDALLAIFSFDTDVQPYSDDVAVMKAYYTVSQKKQDTELLPITSVNIDRFSKFFHC